MLSSVLLFLNIGTPELILILFVALLLFGGEKLPGLARGLGKGIRDFKDASEGVKREINNQIYNYEEKKPATPAEPEVKAEQAAPETPPVTDEAQVAEHKPLIDTTPVHGTIPVGGYQAPAAEPHATETNIDKLAEETHQDKLSK